MLYDVYCYAPPLFLAVSKATAVRSAYNRLIGFVRGSSSPGVGKKSGQLSEFKEHMIWGLKKFFFQTPPDIRALTWEQYIGYSRLKRVQALVRALFKASLGSFDRLFLTYIGSGFEFRTLTVAPPKKKAKKPQKFCGHFSSTCCAQSELMTPLWGTR
jgi:hypothetical protein